MFGDWQSGVIGTLAGTGEPGYSGHGGPGWKAALNEPKNVCFDAVGNLLIADSENHVIRRILQATGVIETVAGRGPSSQSQPSAPTPFPTQQTREEEGDPLADVDDAPEKAYSQTPDLSGTVRYVIGQGLQRDRFAGDEGPATKAMLNFPSAVAVNAEGDIFIADTFNHRIRKVNPTSGTIHTIAGTGHTKWSGDGGPALEATFNEPVALAVEGTRLYIADQSNNRIRLLDLETGVVSTIAGTGETGYNGDGMPALEASLAGPSGLTLDQEGHLYVADTFNGRIRKIDRQTGMISSIVGDGSEFRYERGVNDASIALSRPYGIAVTATGGILITDSDNHLLRYWDVEKKSMSVLAGNGQAAFGGDGAAADTSNLNYPFGVAVDAWGNIAIADTFNHRIRFIGH
ncbi:MAG: hypothetical protein AB7P17_12485 [Nitrospirales bacterium]|nr:hypothetical protein [Nitrospirales bacterium]